MRTRFKPLVGVITLLIWAVAAGSALYWGLRLRAGADGPASAAMAPLPPAPQADPLAVARALGAVSQAASGPAAAAAPGPSVLSRLQLRGVVTHGGGGAALIAIDGKAPKPYPVGTVLEGGWRVRSVTPHAVVIGAGAAEAATLKMPPLAERSRAADAVAPATAPTLAAPAVPPQLPVPAVPAPQTYAPAARLGAALQGALGAGMPPAAGGGVAPHAPSMNPAFAGQ